MASCNTDAYDVSVLLHLTAVKNSSNSRNRVLQAVRTRVEEHWHMTKQLVDYIRLRCVYRISVMTHVLCAVKCPA